MRQRVGKLGEGINDKFPPRMGISDQEEIE